MQDEYKTIKAETTKRAVISRSEFIGFIKEVSSIDEAKAFINQIKNEHKQATHNCSAYVIRLNDKNQEFYDDNGEPGGTAGKPILGAIKSSGITNVVLVVTRYFGGKKLGVRGLIDAYGGVAQEVIQAAEIITKIIEEEFTLECIYENLNQVMYHLQKFEATIINGIYEEKVKIHVRCRVSAITPLKDILKGYGHLK